MKEDKLTRELPACELLTNFSKEERQALSAFGTFFLLQQGEVVIEEHAQQDCLYFLILGRLQARHRGEGGQVKPLGIISAGEWFGEVNIFHPWTSSAEVMSLEPGKVWRITRMDLETYLNQAPALGCLLLLGVGEVLAKRIRKLTSSFVVT